MDILGGRSWHFLPDCDTSHTYHKARLELSRYSISTTRWFLHYTTGQFSTRISTSANSISVFGPELLLLSIA